MEIRVLLFDDNKKMLNSLSVLIESQSGMVLCGAFNTALNIVNEVKIHKPSLVLLDINMPGINGIEALSRLSKEFPDIPVIMLTAFDDEEKILGALRNGARGYLLKSTPPDKLIQLMRESIEGHVPLTNQVADKLLNHFKKPIRTHSDYNLTEREIDVLRLLVKGDSYNEIASILMISYETVRTHIKHLYVKLDVSNVAAAVAKAVRENLVE
jgi:DNA-binding NarL/FixJ family response regulator